MNHIEKIPNKLYSTSNTHRVTNRLVVKYNIREEWLTDEEYEFLLDDIENARIESNASYLPKPASLKPIILSEKDRANCLIWLKSKEMEQVPKRKKGFAK